MKVLLVGPYPPPHGGVSVHVRNAHRILNEGGVHCAVLDFTGRPTYGMARMLGYALAGWKIHVHTNGHNRRSWLVAIAGGLCAQFGQGGVLTLHSGMLPGYLQSGSKNRRAVARLACLMYDAVVGVNSEIREAIKALDVPEQRLEIMPAFLPAPFRGVPLPEEIELWLKRHDPVISSALSFRPEYGFDVLASAFAELRTTYPHAGCLVMGGGAERTAADGLVRELGLTGNVLFAGDVDNDLCLSLMRRSDLFVRATLRDGDANSVREALALGIPVVASDVGARPKGVVLFEPGDIGALTRAMRETLSNAPPAVASETGDDSFMQLQTLYAR